MSKKNRVSVTVSLKDKFSGTLKKLDKQLDKIDQKVVSPEFKFGDNGQIEKVKQDLRSIDNSVTTKLNILGKGSLKETQASINTLSGVEHVYVKVHDNDVARAISRRKTQIQRDRMPGSGKTGRRRGGSPLLRKDLFKFDRRFSKQGFVGGVSGMDFKDLDERFSGPRRFGMRDLSRHDKRFAGMGIRGGATGFDLDDLGERFGGERRRRRRRGIASRVAGTAKRIFSPASVGGGGGEEDRPSRPVRAANMMLRKGRPTGQTMQDTAAFFMPFTYSALVAGMGAVAAATGPAVAGITTLSLGILGFGENAADSLHLAQVRLRLFGREMHKVFKPSMKTFAPWVDQWMKTIPHTLGNAFNRPIQDMVVWKPTLDMVGTGLIAWTVDFLDVMNQLHPVIDRVLQRLGGDVGDGLIRFFVWLIEELDTNYDMLKTTIGAFKELAIFMYRLLTLWTQAIANLSPLINGLGTFINLIAQSPVLKFIVSWVFALGLLLAVITKIGASLAALVAFWSGGATGAILTALGAKIAATWAWFAALSAVGKAAAVAMGILTGGAAVVAGLAAASVVSSQLASAGAGSGGAGSNAPPSRRMAGGNTVNIYGDPDTATVQKFKDIFPGEHRQEGHIGDRMSRDL